MRRFLLILTGAILLILSCDEKFIIVDCTECIADEPLSASITVSLETYDIVSIYIEIFEGNYEDNILIDSFYPSSAEVSLDLLVNRKYTIAATYKNIKGNECVAIDNLYPRVKYETQQCEMPCYYVYNTHLNLRLKYSNF